MNDVLNKQVGGDHYKSMSYQPITLCEWAGVVGGFSLGNVFKYLCRYPYKGKSVEDLKKARHYIELHELFTGSYTFIHKAGGVSQLNRECRLFITSNFLEYKQGLLLRAAVFCTEENDYSLLKQMLDMMISELEVTN